jgi:hypothetical protein
MSILRERKVWRREVYLPVARKLSRLSPEQQENVRRAMRYLTVKYGGPRKFAAALGVSYQAFWKLRNPSRAIPVRRAVLVAALAQVPVDDVLTGRWPTECPHCNGTGCLS